MKQRMSSLAKKLNRDTAPTKLEWGIAFLLFAFFFSSFCYADAASIIRYEINFADSLLHGDFLHFYRIAFDSAAQTSFRGGSAPTYDCLVNLLLAIWGIPLYFWNKFSGVDFTRSFLQTLYGKSILLVALVLATILVYKVCRSLSLSKLRSQWGAFLFFTSILSTTCVGIIGQSDILGMVFILAGLRAYVQNNDRQFLLWFILAYPFKQYVLFLFVPLMLLRDKNLVRIGLKLCAVLAFTWITNLPLRNDPDILDKKAEFASTMFARLTANKLPFLDSSASILIVLLGVLCVYCFVHKPIADQQEQNKLTVFVSLAAMSIVFTCFPSFPYWFLHLAPYLAIVYNAGETKNLLLFETFGGLAFLIYNYAIYYFCYDIYCMDDMLIDRLFGNVRLVTDPFTLSWIATEVGLDAYTGIFAAGYLVCLGAILWLCRPSHCTPAKEDDGLCIRLPALARLAGNTLLCLVPIILFINALPSVNLITR